VSNWSRNFQWKFQKQQKTENYWSKNISNLLAELVTLLWKNKGKRCMQQENTKEHGLFWFCSFKPHIYISKVCVWYYSTSHMPLTRYPKKKPEEQMKNCCHLGLWDREIPNKLRACSAFDINVSSSATLHHKANVERKKVCMFELCFPTSDADKNIMQTKQRIKITYTQCIRRRIAVQVYTKCSTLSKFWSNLKLSKNKNI